MEKRVIIDLTKAADEKVDVSGEVEAAALMGTDQTGSLRTSGSISYSAQGQVYDGKELVVEVKMDVPLKVRCERCLEEFDYTLHVPCTISVSLKGDEQEVDLTEDLHEEVMLALPTYPKCELIGKTCQINDIMGEFGLDKAPQPGVNSAAPSGQSVWDALDAVSTDPTK